MTTPTTPTTPDHPDDWPASSGVCDHPRCAAAPGSLINTTQCTCQRERSKDRPEPGTLSIVQWWQATGQAAKVIIDPHATSPGWGRFALVDCEWATRGFHKGRLMVIVQRLQASGKVNRPIKLRADRGWLVER